MLVADDMIERLVLPQCSGAAKRLADGVSRE
jgi:hypothetical protein